MSIKALVLFSGGQDSTTCLAQACNDFPGRVAAVAFDYGQRHRVELEQAQIIAKLADVPLTVVPLPFISDLTSNALTRPDMDIATPTDSLPNTFVDGRNLFFLSVAAVIAKQQDCSILYTGVCETDYSGYPDCRQSFITSCTETLNLAMDYTFEIRTPLMYLTKAETVLLMKNLNCLDWYAHTHTCYNGQRPACGTCPACELRLKGFADAGLTDPLEYQ
ncbi:7-cyano-7-deazaguanine synthase QueC [Candidatus Marinamargulisbacteria bacterium SCGC AG-414-C22]|nr:7-cyano-7-deazaguanine synthase QueC [Candidatus Marinamargulisbacteria bacterium SCGC AG-414-C22]